MAVVRHRKRLPLLLALLLLGLPRQGRKRHFWAEVKVNVELAPVGFAVVFLAVAHPPVVGNGVAAPVHVPVIRGGVGVVGAAPIQRREVAGCTNKERRQKCKKKTDTCKQGSAQVTTRETNGAFKIVRPSRKNEANYKRHTHKHTCHTQNARTTNPSKPENVGELVSFEAHRPPVPQPRALVKHHFPRLQVHLADSPVRQEHLLPSGMRRSCKNCSP